MSLTVKDLTKRYGDRTVVDRLSFGMPGPGVYALLGTNGAGKTTSIRMMLNMLSRDGGEVLWNGEPLDISRCNVGYLAEERGLYPKYALMDQLLYFASLRDVPRAEAKRRIRYWAQRLEVEEYLYPSAPAQTGRRGLLGGSAQREKPKRPDQLSKGNQQKIQLMAALLSDPELLILDEPTKGIDSFFKETFAAILADLKRQGITIVMVSHDVEFCARYADQVSMFFDGQVLTTDTPRRFFGANSFYTTAANRMSRHVFRNAVTAEDVVDLYKQNLETKA